MQCCVSDTDTRSPQSFELQDKDSPPGTATLNKKAATTRSHSKPMRPFRLFLSNVQPLSSGTFSCRFITHKGSVHVKASKHSMLSSKTTAEHCQLCNLQSCSISTVHTYIQLYKLRLKTASAESAAPCSAVQLFSWVPNKSVSVT